MKTATQELSISERYECIGECVLVEPLEEKDEVTPGGIVRPEIARRKSNKGRVVALGEGRLIEGRWMPLNLFVGDIVEYSKLAIGMDKEIDGKMYLKLHWKQLDLVDIQERKRLGNA